MPQPSPDERRGRTALDSVRDHPVVTTVMVACTVGGAIAGPALLGDGLSLIRQVLGGALAGAGVGLLMTGTKMLAS